MLEQQQQEETMSRLVGNGFSHVGARFLLFIIVFQCIQGLVRGDCIRLEGIDTLCAGCTAPRCPKTPCFTPGYSGYNPPHSRLCPGGCFVQQGKKWVRCPRTCAFEQLCVKDDNIEPYLIAKCEESQDSDKESWEVTFYGIPDIVQCGATGDPIRTFEEDIDGDSTAQQQVVDTTTDSGNDPSDLDGALINCETKTVGDTVKVECELKTQD